MTALQGLSAQSEPGISSEYTRVQAELIWARPLPALGDTRIELLGLGTDTEEVGGRTRVRAETHRQSTEVAA